MSHDKLHRDQHPQFDPPRRPLPFVWWLAFAVVSAMLVVAVVRGEW